MIAIGFTASSVKRASLIAPFHSKTKPNGPTLDFTCAAMPGTKPIWSRKCRYSNCRKLLSNTELLASTSQSSVQGIQVIAEGALGAVTQRAAELLDVVRVVDPFERIAVVKVNGPGVRRKHVGGVATGVFGVSIGPQ